MRYFSSAIFAVCFFTFLPSVTLANITTNDFVTTWDTTLSGTSNSNQITIPGTGSGYSYSIYWESLSSSTATGTIATSTSASKTITFPEPGQYKVAIKGTYPRIYFNNGGDKLKILTVEQWGNIAWTSMSGAFYGCANLTVPATDAPNLSGATNLNSMFREATLFNSPINHWDVSNVTTVSYMLANTSFNQPLNSWNVSKVTDMSSLFRYTPFNQPLNNWNTASATIMSSLFHGATFNQDIGGWNVSNLRQTIDMFKENTSFNQPLNSWDMSNTLFFSDMFQDATSFNQPLNNWNTVSAQSMRRMFEGATAFDQDLGSWDMTSIVASTTGHLNGLDEMLLNSHLSTTNLDSTLQGWSAQSLKSNIPFHLGLKTYSSTGQTALDTLRNTYNWTISEQYQANYQEGDDYTISGTTIQSPINHGSTTTAVEVIPDDRCEFINWSDGNTNNPRTDTLTDNITVLANVECRNPTTSTSVKGRADKLEALGNEAKADALRAQYHLTPNSTLHTAIINIKTLTTNPTIINNPQTRQQLISLLQQLVQILKGMTGESN